MPRHPEPDPVKGDPIYVSAGSYKGKHGWRNEAKSDTAKMAYVIIDMGNGLELATRIKKTSLGPMPQAPRNYTEAAVQQIPDIDYHLKRAAYHLAKCQIHDLQDLAQIFGAMLLEARSELDALGPKAEYYGIRYTDNTNNNQNNNNQNV